MVIRDAAGTGLSGEELNRKLERLLSDDPTEEEVKAMWADRDRVERLYALRIETNDYGPDFLPLDGTDEALWRFKIRAEMNSLFAIVEALELCKGQSLIPPDWLFESAIFCAELLARRGSDDDSKQVASRYKADVRKLKGEKRARLVAKLLLRERVRSLPEHSVKDSVTKLPEEVERAIQRGRLRQDFVVENVDDAAEIVSICLEGTWASGKPSTVRDSYFAAKRQLTTDLEVDELSDRQYNFIGWDTGEIPDSLIERLIPEVSEK